MALNGIDIKTTLFESVIQQMAEGVAECLIDDFLIDAHVRAGVDSESLTRRLQADPDFRQLCGTEAQDVVQTALNDLNDDYDIANNLYTELSENMPNHWVADMLDNLQKHQDDIELEDSLKQDAEREQSVTEALKVLAQHGIQVEERDPALMQALRTVQNAGYRVLQND